MCVIEILSFIFNSFVLCYLISDMHLRTSIAIVFLVSFVFAIIYSDVITNIDNYANEWTNKLRRETQEKRFQQRYKNERRKQEENFLYNEWLEKKSQFMQH